MKSSNFNSFLFSFFFLLLSFSTVAQSDLPELNDDGQNYYIEYSGTYQDFIIPINHAYNAIRFYIKGGDGGKAKLGSCESSGGDGAEILTTLLIGNGAGKVAPGSVVRMIVGDGGQSQSHDTQFAWAAGGGGGGSAVLFKEDQDWEILAVAGGGGGAYQGSVVFCVDSQKGQGGRSSTSGGNGEGDLSGGGGTNGNGGEGGGDVGDGDLSGGGGGVYSDGTGTYSKEGGAGFPTGGAAGKATSG